MADNLVQRGGTWHVRFDIPKDVQTAFGNRKILSQSLGTGSRTEAMRLRLSVLSLWKTQVEEIRSQKLANGDKWRESLAQAAGDSRRTLTRKVNDALDGIQPLQQRGPEYMSSLLKALEPSFAVSMAEYIDAGIEPEAAAGIIELLKKELTTSGMESIGYHKQVHDALRDVRLRYAIEDHHLSASEASEAQVILTDPAAFKPKSPISKHMLDAWKAHLEHQLDSEKSRDAHISRIQRLSEYMTSEGKQLSFDTVHDFLESVSSARKTRQQYLWSGREFWQWACKYHSAFRDQFAKVNSPFEGHSLPKVGKASGESYVPFTATEVEHLHAKAMERGDIPLANLIVFGAFTGCRLEEMGRLKPEDTILKGGKPVGFKINEAKTSAGVRQVPIHPGLLPLYNHLCSQAEANDGFLFPGGNNKYGNRLDALSKRFGRLKKDYYSHLHTFHSIRKTVVTELHQRGVTMEILPFIVGHESKAFTLDVYSSGPSFKQKQAAIGKLKFSFAGILCVQ
ncbi:DUF6538 domain-containing protein [Pseudomonas izuensis]|uniref:DUF6538 domain-containing protein n=1 Tax=Pseudomonas izuensis TaxID=2684212 RepID=UPI0013591610|nr:DUF6538 domain-containing protein [Pseudomonas izuensis]